MPNYFLNTASLFSEISHFQEKTYLLTVSGGVDSMLLLHLFKENKIKFSVAHCNFQLRGKESDLDQLLVQETCKKMNVPFFVKSFETKEYKEKAKVSTQMAARELRYAWFNELRSIHGFDYIVTGHHLNDSVETVLLNLVRGTGLDGLTGLETVSSHLFRPLLSLSKDEIRQIALDNNIEFREDASNSSNDYKRNKLRNKVIPLLQELNPSFLETMSRNMDNFQRQNLVYNKIADKELSDTLISTKESDFYIDIKKLKTLEFPNQVLYHFLKTKGFNFSTVSQLIDCLLNDKNPTGKFFYSQEYKALINRDNIIVSSKATSELARVEINKMEQTVTYPIKLTLKRIPKENGALIFDKNVAYFDEDKIKYPIILRKWEKGDVFSPFGMVGKKKVSDLLIDIKVSRNDKDKVFVLESDQEIIWVVGYRSSEKFKLTSTTKTVLTIKLD